MANDYILKSSKEDISAAIRKVGVMFGKEADDAAEMILEYCPKQLHQNIDEIVNGEPITDIYFEWELDTGHYTETFNTVSSDCYNKLYPITVLIGICKEFKGEYGLAWLCSFFM